MSDPELGWHEGRDTYEIATRGRAIVILNPATCSRTDFAKWWGRTIGIDGKVYTVRGVESFAIEYQGAGRPIGILVGAAEA